MSTPLVLLALLLSATPQAVESAPFSPSWPLERFPGWDAWGPALHADFGRELAAADVNGDGRADAVVASPGTAQAFVYLGSPQGLSVRPQVLHAPSPSDRYFAQRVWAAGDVNGDGRADVWVGSGGSKDGRGHLALFPGMQNGLATRPVLTLDVPASPARLPLSVAPGDVDGDGRADLLLARCGRRQLELWTSSGMGKPAGPVWQAPFPDVASGPSMGAGFDCTLALAGDLTGDGRPDALLRVFGCEDETEINCDSRVFLYPSVEGRERPFAAPVALDLEPLVGADPRAGVSDWTVGTTMHARGDVDGDGKVDIVLCAPGPDMGEHQDGRLYVLYGPIQGGRARAAQTLALFEHTEFGDVRAVVGDVDRDGKADVLVAALTAHNVDWGHDRVLLLRGGAGGLASQSSWQVTEESKSYGAFGRGLALADFDGDGALDALIGAPEANVGVVPVIGLEPRFLSFGRVLLFPGGGASGRFDGGKHTRALPRPACGDLSTDDCGGRP